MITRILLRPKTIAAIPSSAPSSGNLRRTFCSTQDARFKPTITDLDRHPRARRLPVYEPPGAFPEAGDMAAQLAYREPTISVPGLEEPLLDYMIGLLMRQGKRTIAEKHVINLLTQLRLVTGQEPFPLLSKAIQIAAPLVMTRNEKKRIKVTTLPLPLNETQQARKAILWIVKLSDRRPGKKFGHRLAMEVIAVLNGNSDVLRLKAEQHKLAFVNRANLRTRVSRA
ncbi:hypothetical protein MJO28_006391 [Puccinia striiformis f. sp. tritici]|uniref:Small ribosomal subunit protein uS7 domain-containing protein n=3 Tax=Puccinia striiformis TaxID=27350 RepID=A0A2S4VSK0_9BASI|nr:hypothetical protein Pst134EA_011565 [Puccinia striiformis f. sp. tritici]KAI9605161.1 hypothetical protein H4Q26_003136 [Puccinia striiformis f. sp. tritici PST-130]POW12449.1 hypothetical protein PSTT_04521 [Puccinia striiformis]KAH9456353.1 hypothetical protein Pst134EB_012553 [Puccinia striiformis f. sp. tritici]KAH9467945.1 hypothetical protein Pst134EA_011565 [Puccinia striiformis f. sp. tritici]KAI7953844.1 hypothetical protein MJO28_006391 [Puccinia striiformis f. sp. tritici]